MALTPIDIVHTEFKTAMNGYKKSQVDEFVKSAMEALELALKDKVELQNKVNVFQEEFERIRNIETTLTQTLTLAQKNSDELIANAHKKVELILQEGEQSRVKMAADLQTNIEKNRTELALLKAQKERFECEFKSMLNAYMEWMDKHPLSEESDEEVA